MSNFVIYFLVQFQIILIGSKIGCAANPHLTILNVGSPFNNAGNLQCYPTHSNTSISMGKVFKIFNTDSLVKPPLTDQSYRFPYAKRLDIPYDTNFFGVYYCEGQLNGETITVKTTVVDLQNAYDSDVTPTNGKTSITASVGDYVTVSFDVTAASGNHIWRKDDELLQNYETLYNDASLDFTSVSVENGGMYELYIDGQRDQHKHSFIELIVRECPAGRWGAPRCINICNNCYNGGVCDDETGNCVCAPGFRGENCDETCGGNRFGFNCEIRCTFHGDPKDKCRGFQYCLNNPYGCSCITGFTGLNCSKGCGVGKFGAGCSQECHCTSGTCNQYTGECTGTGGCESGWSGSNCQVPSTCPDGYFGSACTLICHCRDNVQCDKGTGVCSNGECAEGYRIYAKSFCETCQSGSYGESCASTCNCHSDSCHHENGCDGGCLNNWLPNTCTTGISSVSNTKVNPGQMTTFQCDIQGDVTGVTIQLLIDSQPATERGRTELSGVTRVSFTGEANPGIAYVCQLTKDSHTAYETLSLTTYELPTYTGQPTLETITGSSMKLRWREWSTSSGDTGDPRIIGYVVYYKLSSYISWSKIPQVSSLTATVTGLHWEQRYKFTIAPVREGDGGEGPMGSGIISAWTLCGEPSAPVVSTSSSYESPKTINIFWKQLTNEESKCSTGINHYNVSYRAVNTDMATITEETTKELSYTIMGLETYTEYSIAVTASNKDSPGIARVVQVFSPEEKPPPPDVSAVHEGTYLTVSVMPSESIEYNLYGDIKGYDVRYRIACDEEWMELTITKDQGSNGYKITSLKTDADYKVSARVINGAGAGNWSTSIKAVTGTSTGTGSSIPGFMIALVVVLFIIIIILLSLLFGLYYRYKQANGNNTHKCEDQVTTNTRVVEEDNDNYTKLIKDDLTQQNQYDAIQTETQDTYDYAMPMSSGPEVTTPEENTRVDKDKYERYKIPLKQMGHESISVSNDIPQYTNIK